MRAVLCKSFGPPDSLVLEEVESPPLGDREVRIAIHSAGVNYPDLLLIQGLYQSQADFPFAPGMEVAGTVSEIGDRVEGVTIGDRVIAPLPHGGYADEAVAPAAALIPVPERMDLGIAGGYAMTFTTGYHALVQRGNLQPGETLLVHGASGGSGLAAVQIGKALGARVIGTGGDDEKLRKVTELGADEVVNYRTNKIRAAVKELTDGVGADVIFDPVGGDIFDESLRSIAWGGRLLVIGFTGGRIAEAPTNRILLKGCSVVGVFSGAFVMRENRKHRDNVEVLNRWYDEGLLSLHVSRTLPLELAHEALEGLRDRKIVGKWVLSTGR